MITGLAHVGCAVDDLDAAMRFYIEDLGIEHGRTQLSDQPYLSDVNGLPDCRIRIGFALIDGDATPLEVLQYLSPPGKPSGAGFGRPGSPHVCWQVDDLSAVLERSRGQGVTVLTEPRRIEHGPWSGWSGAYLRGPADLLIELVAEDGSAGGGRLQRIHHVGYQVADLGRTIDFMVGVLGFGLDERMAYDDVYYAGSAGEAGARLQVAFLTFPGSAVGLELLEFAKPDAISADPANHNVGALHCCFMVDDIHSTCDEMTAAGVEFVGPPAAVTAGINKGAHAIYFVGPDGLRFELFQGRPTSVTG